MGKSLVDKKGPLNWSLFNFLENLLVFRTMEERAVPADSKGGVKFRITPQDSDKGVCLLIHIDNQKYPIFKDGEPRPDYLAIYLSVRGCICTIIEMKGGDLHRLSHGVDQIKSLADRLRQEFTECLPGNFRLHIQGILLCPYEANIPRKKIADLQKTLPVLPLLYSHSAELFPYISNKHEMPPVLYKHEKRRSIELGLLEKVFSERSIKTRYTNRRQSNLHICFKPVQPQGKLTLVTQQKHLLFQVHNDNTDLANQLRNDIRVNRLDSKFQVEIV